VHFSGTEVDLGVLGDANVGSFDIAEADTQTGASAPTGGFTSHTVENLGVSLIQMQAGADSSMLGQACL